MNEDQIAELLALKALVTKLTAEQVARVAERAGQTVEQAAEQLLAAGERALGRMEMRGVSESDRQRIAEKAKVCLAAILDTIALPRNRRG